MQKNSRFFTFQFSYSKSNTIKIRRFDLSRKLVQTGSLSIFLIAVFSTFGIGIHGLIKSTAFASTIQNNSLSDQFAAARLETSGYNYSRPKASEAMAVNSGGPVDIGTTVIDDPNVEAELAEIIKTSDAENIPTAWAHLG